MRHFRHSPASDGFDERREIGTHLTRSCTGKEEEKKAPLNNRGEIGDRRFPWRLAKEAAGGVLIGTIDLTSLVVNWTPVLILGR